MQTVIEINGQLELFKVGNTLPDLPELDEDCHFIIVSDGERKVGHLVLYYEEPTAEEISEIENGELLSGAFNQCEDVVFLHKVGSLPWNDIPVLRKLVKYEQELALVLIDSNTNKVIVNRKVSFPDDYSKHILEQVRKPVVAHEVLCDGRVLNHQEHSPEHHSKNTCIYKLEA